jgi:hypothetical protein
MTIPVVKQLSRRCRPDKQRHATAAAAVAAANQTEAACRRRGEHRPGRRLVCFWCARHECYHVGTEFTYQEFQGS